VIRNAVTCEIIGEYVSFMTEIVLYHNPRCSKSREVLSFLKDRDVDVVIVEYLKNLPSRSEYDKILVGLRGEPGDLVRRDARFVELGIDPAKCETADQVAALLVKHPELLARPVVMRGTESLVARPPERVLELSD